MFPINIVQKFDWLTDFSFAASWYVWQWNNSNIQVANFLSIGLIHANHGEKIIDYILQQLKSATSDVCIDFVAEEQLVL